MTMVYSVFVVHRPGGGACAAATSAPPMCVKSVSAATEVGFPRCTGDSNLSQRKQYHKQWNSSSWGKNWGGYYRGLGQRQKACGGRGSGSGQGSGSGPSRLPESVLERAVLPGC
eukprot:827876-Amphidinium_carterae.1